MARLNPTNFGTQNFYSATLTGDITSSSLTIGLDTVPTPTSGILVIEPDSTTNREVILYTGKTASTITLPSDGRGFDGSTAVAHLTGTTIIYAPVKRLFEALASGELSTDPLRTESLYDFIASGAVWTGDSLGSTRNASMSAGVMYIGGRRLTLTAVTARTFTASRDTYIDATDNLDGTVLLTYSEVTNNAASPALATNAVRIGIIVTGASSIATSASINQGATTATLPLVSTQPLTVVDTLGNLINPRDPQRKLIGYRKLTAQFSTNSTTGAEVTQFTSIVNVPVGRRVKLTVHVRSLYNSGVNYTQVTFWRGAVVSGTQLDAAVWQSAIANQELSGDVSTFDEGASGSTTYRISLQTNSGASNAVFTDGGASAKAWFTIELE